MCLSWPFILFGTSTWECKCLSAWCMSLWPCYTATPSSQRGQQQNWCPATYIEFENLENDASQGHLQGKFNNISTTDLESIEHSGEVLKQNQPKKKFVHANILQWHLKQTDPSIMHGTHHSQQVLRRLISVNYHITRLIHTLQLISCNPISYRNLQNS
jgi:hypothetical protein